MDDLNRTFVGIRLPADVQSKLAEVQQVVRHRAGSDVVRFANPHELQLVILALGELTVATLDQVHRTITPLLPQFRPFELTVDGLGGSPSMLQPRFVWAGIGGDVAELTKLHNIIEANLISILRDYHARPFQPHIDLGRMKIESEQNRTALGRAIKMSQVGYVASLNVSSIETFRSTATPAGPTLEPITIYRLDA